MTVVLTPAGFGIVWNAATVQTAQAKSPAATAQPKATAASAPSEVYKNVYNGWKWWHVYCYRCHGTNAIATSVAPSLIDPNRRMTLPMFVSTARNGRPNLGMQSWRKLLDDKQLEKAKRILQDRGIDVPGAKQQRGSDTSDDGQPVPGIDN